MSRTTQQTNALLALLHREEIPFVVVGGVAAIAHGSSLMTRDLDIVMPMTPALLDRLLAALTPYHPRHALRQDLGPVTQDGAALATFRMLLFQTDLGRLDVVAEVPPVGGFDSLATIEVELVAGHVTRIVALDQLIAIKESAGRPKDQIAAQELRAISATRNDVPPD